MRNDLPTILCTPSALGCGTILAIGFVGGVSFCVAGCLAILIFLSMQSRRFAVSAWLFGSKVSTRYFSRDK